MSADQIVELSEADKVWLERATNHIATRVRSEYGPYEITSSVEDLEPLQRLINEKQVTARDLLEAQCIGVVLGHVFVNTTSMRWKRVINEYGDLLALHCDRIQFTLYPISMVSKRLEDSRSVELRLIYEDLSQSLHIRTPPDDT